MIFCYYDALALGVDELDFLLDDFLPPVFFDLVLGVDFFVVVDFFEVGFLLLGFLDFLFERFLLAVFFAVLSPPVEEVDFFVLGFFPADLDPTRKDCPVCNRTPDSATLFKARRNGVGRTSIFSPSK